MIEAFRKLLIAFGYQYFRGEEQHYIGGMQLEMAERFENVIDKCCQAMFSDQRPIVEECCFELAKLFVEDGKKSMYDDTVYTSEDQICLEIVRYSNLDGKARATILIANDCKRNADNLLLNLNNRGTATVCLALKNWEEF